MNTTPADKLQAATKAYAAAMASLNANQNEVTIRAAKDACDALHAAQNGVHAARGYSRYGRRNVAYGR